MTEEQLKELAARFAGHTMHIDEFAEIVCDRFDITHAAAWRLIVEHLPTTGGVVRL